MSNYIGIETPDTVCGINLDQIIKIQYNKGTGEIRFLTNNPTCPEISAPGTISLFNTIAEKIKIGKIEE